MTNASKSLNDIAVAEHRKSLTARTDARTALACDMFSVAYEQQSRVIEAGAEAFFCESPRMAEAAAALPEPWRARALALL